MSMSCTSGHSLSARIGEGLSVRVSAAEDGEGSVGIGLTPSIIGDNEGGIENVFSGILLIFNEQLLMCCME